MGNLASSYFTAGRRDEALEIRKVTLALQKTELGPTIRHTQKHE